MVFDKIGEGGGGGGVSVQFGSQVSSHGGNGMRALTQWQHPVALSEAVDVLYWAMCPASTKFPAIHSTAFFVVVDSLSPTNNDKIHGNN